MTRATLRGVRLRSILLMSQRGDGSNPVLLPGRANAAAGLIAAHPVLPKNVEGPGRGTGRNPCETSFTPSIS